MAHANEGTDKKQRVRQQAHSKMKGRSRDDAKKEKEADGRLERGTRRVQTC